MSETTTRVHHHHKIIKAYLEQFRGSGQSRFKLLVPFIKSIPTY